MSEIPPQPFGTFQQWGERLNAYLARVRNNLDFKNSDARATQDGIMLWDPANQQVVVSHDGEWQGLGHNDFGAFYTTTTFTAAAANTAYPITWTNTAASSHISVDDTVTSRIVFTHAATYKLDFSAEVVSSNSSQKTIYIFPRINGVDIPYSTIIYTITNNGAKRVVSRSGIFTVAAGDYLEAVYAVTDTAIKIEGSAATAFSPEAPSATLMVTEVKV